MNEERKFESGTLTGGIILIAIGALFLLDRIADFDFDFGDVISDYWPVIIIVIGISKLFRRRGIWSGLWLIAIGVWLQISHLGWFGLSWNNSWPLLLIILGAGLILRAIFESRTPAGGTP